MKKEEEGDITFPEIISYTVIMPLIVSTGAIGIFVVLINIFN